MTYSSDAAPPEIRVLVVDDSAFMRHAIERLLRHVPNVKIIGFAADGLEAVTRTLELRPNVITMDVEMPRMDGVSAVAEIMQVVPTPIVMLSTLTIEGAETTIRALEAGALDFVAKPGILSKDLVNVSGQLAQAIQRASLVRPHRRRPIVFHPPTGKSTTAGDYPSRRVVVIGSSTGGPPALTQVVPHLPADLPAGVIVVQHMPVGFTAALARRLDSLSALNVSEAKEGDVVAQGRVLVAPGDFHLVVTPERRVRLDRSAAIHGVRPTVDVTLDSIAPIYGQDASVAILTGMGKDGADGAARVEQAGGSVFVQDEATCVVYGMPRVTRERTCHSIEVPLDSVADAIARSLARAAV